MSINDKRTVDDAVTSKKLVIETGSHLGDGINKFIENGFERIVSIEIDTILFEHCKNRFRDNESVEMVNGNSVDYLRENIQKMPDEVLFFLDAHFSGGITSYADGQKVPLLEELEIILSGFMGDTCSIIIDDADYFSEDEKDFAGEDYEWWSGITESKVLDVLAAHPKFSFEHYYAEDKKVYVVKVSRKK